MRKLKIAVFTTSHYTTPLPHNISKAPVQVAYELMEELTKRGHEITYYAPQGSQLPFGKVITLDQPPLKQNNYIVEHSSDFGDREQTIFRIMWDQLFVDHILQEAAQKTYDVVHTHTPIAVLPLGYMYPTVPIVQTLHESLTPWRKHIYATFNSPNQWIVSISNAQRQPAPDLNYAATIYNGINIDQFPFSATAENHLLFVGRMEPAKGAAEAIQVAKNSGESLKIVGHKGSETYWQENIQPFLSEKIEYLGHFERNQLYHHYQKAKALLMPIQWEEPFGLVMIEAMACGTPVIAFRRGSVPEVVVDGKTGFIVNSVEEMGEALKKIDTIDRRACREHVEKNFSIGKMVDKYEQTYYDILDKQPRS